MEEIFRIELNTKNRYSFGVYHAGFELFHHLLLENKSESCFENLHISIQTTPNILLKGDCVVDFLLPHASRFISCDFVCLDVSALACVQHVLNVDVSVTVLDEQGNVLQKESFPCTVTPFSYFGGWEHAFEEIPFFVTPNQRELDQIDLTDSFSDPLVSSEQVYDSIKPLKISFSSEAYTSPALLPVRLCERVLKERFANSLEMGILVSSCLERIGLNPILAYAGKSGVFVGFSISEGKSKLVHRWEKNQKNFEDFYLLDCRYFAYGSELTFDQALFHSKNTLAMCDDNVDILDIRCARKYGLIPLPRRVFSDGTWQLSDSGEEKIGNRSEYFSLLEKLSEDRRAFSILSGGQLRVSGSKPTLPFQEDLDVNQNKILSKILTNDFTLIRAQTGSGATTVFSRAALQGLKTGKRVLYITDSHYHGEDFADMVSKQMDPCFLLDLTREAQEIRKGDFAGIFEPHETIYDDREKAANALKNMDSFYRELEGDNKIVSSFLTASDRYHQLKDANDSIIFSPEQIGMLSDEMVQSWFSTVNELIKAFAEIETISENPLSLVRRKQFSYEFKSQFIRKLEDVKACIEAISLVSEQVSAYFPSVSNFRSFGVFLAFQELTRLFGEFATVPESFFEKPERIEENFRNVTHLIQAKKENDSIFETVTISFHEGVFDLDAFDLFTRYQALSADKGLKGISQKHAILKTVKRFLKPNCDVENIEYILTRLLEHRKNRDFISREKDNVFRLLSVLPKDGNDDWDGLQFAADLCYQCYSVFLNSLSTQQLPFFVSEYRKAAEMPGVLDAFSRLRDLTEDFNTKKSDLESLLANRIDFHYSPISSKEEDYFGFIYQKLSVVLASCDHLKSWCNWLSVKEKAEQIGLKSVTAAIESGKLKPQECKKSFLRAFFKSVCEYNFITHPNLVPGAFHFAEKIKELENAKSQLPEKSAREINSILSVRRLEAYRDWDKEIIDPLEVLRTSPNLFFDMFPCVVSDGKSAIRAFGNVYHSFDIVLIESRTSLAMVDFLQLLYLGKNVAFAGSFSCSEKYSTIGFDLSEPAFDRLWKITDEKYNLSAIYDSDPSLVSARRDFSFAMRSDCNAYSAPSATLENSLEWITLRGFYNTEIPEANREEAELCVEKLIQFAMQETERSIGIVTLTQAQKRLILRTLTQKLRHQEDLARYFQDYRRFYIASVEDPLRKCDEVILSVTFAPSQSQPYSGMPRDFYEFGQNDPYLSLFKVLSSAMEKFTVLSSFSPDVFKFSQSVLPAGGALHLLHQVLTVSPVNRTFSITNAFDHSVMIRDVKERLIENGFSVFSGVQCGRYYIDLALQDGEGNFILGILSDQTVLNQKANISAIELANQRYYEKRGWKIYRLRSNHAFDSFEKEMDSILATLAPERNWI